MTQTAVQAQPSDEISGGSPGQGEERHAPNGRIAVLIDGRWAGYLFEESETGRGNNRTMVLFEVTQNGGGLFIRYMTDCRGKSKKTLEKRIHRDHDIKFFDARTNNGARCQLFTL